MCGIVATASCLKAREYVINGLKLLEYRGYDSTGLYYKTKTESKLIRTTDSVDSLYALTPNFGEGLAIGHTRWATHGNVSEINAHPQPSYDHKVHVIHNGVISNYLEIKERLEKLGIEFRSKTDTEVIANLGAIYSEQCETLVEVLEKINDTLRGQMSAIVAIDKFPNSLGFIRRGSPLLIGRKGNEYFLSSDTLPFYGYASEYLDIPDNSYGVASPIGVNIYHKGQEIDLSYKKLDKDMPNISMGEYKTHMLKEIDEEEEVISRIIDNLDLTSIDEGLKNRFKNDNIIIVGAGTSFNAGLKCSAYFGSKASVKLASEFIYDSNSYDNTIFIMLSQSGETFDLIKCLPKIKEGNNNVLLSIVNASNSTIERESDYCFKMMANREISVASTKAYMSEIVILYMISRYLEGSDCSNEMRDLIEELSKVKDIKDEIKRVASKYSLVSDAYFIGREKDYDTSLEMSLKLKEVSYIHSEALYGGELKHGPIALVHDNFLSIFTLTDDKYKEPTLNSISEIKARKGKTIILSTIGKINEDDGYQVECKNPLSYLVLVRYIQYFTYYSAIERKLNVDKPRNLAKSVTVE